MPLDDLYSWFVTTAVVESASSDPAGHPAREWKLSRAGWAVIVLVIIAVFTYLGVRAFR